MVRRVDKDNGRIAHNRYPSTELQRPAKDVVWMHVGRLEKMQYQDAQLCWYCDGRLRSEYICGITNVGVGNARLIGIYAMMMVSLT